MKTETNSRVKGGGAAGRKVDIPGKVRTQRLILRRYLSEDSTGIVDLMKKRLDKFNEERRVGYSRS